MSRHHFLRTLTFIVLLHCSISLPVIDLFNLEDEVVNVRATDVAYRLPEDFYPTSYEIELSNIDLSAQVFTGRTIITFVPQVNTDTLKLHVSNLVYEADNVVLVNLNNPTLTITKVITEDTLYEMLTITANPAFIAGNTYTITFPTYSGVMNHAMRGFYTSRYTAANGDTVLLGTTQMQPTHARKVFPCFDEPRYKATFKLSIERPTGYEPSISNMKLDPEITSDQWDRFYETPIMSTYLLAFIVSTFVALEQTTGDADADLFRVIGRPNAPGQGQYAFEEGQKLLDSMSNYMNLPYYQMGNNKMDQAAIPDFSAGAMENWGLLTYREAYLLADENTSVRYRQQISLILAHEITHMWFGDYVTCHWWSDTWLNEGFARLFQYKMPDMVESTMFNTMTQFPILQVQTALLADTTIRSAALTNEEVNSPAEVSGHFGTISYNKGASILRMMAAWMGEENFQTAMNQFMQAHAYGIITPSDLYASLQLYSPSGQNAATIMSTWVSQSGFPVLDVTVNYEEGTMSISQSRFKKAWEDDLDSLYQIPITYATKSEPDFEDTTTNVLMTTANLDVNIPIEANDWIILNKQQIGYYRVNYDENTWSVIRSALMGDDREVIHQLNRGQIVDDLFNLAREDVISYNITLDVLDFLQFESDYAPWQSAYPGLAFIRQQFNSNRDLLARFDEHVLILMETLIETLGFSDEGDLLTQLFRLNTMNFACALGHEGCVEYATTAFNAYIQSGTAVTPNHREFVYCQGLRQGGTDAFESLWQKLLTDNLANEQLVLMTALGCSTNEDSIYFLLDQIMLTDSVIRVQDMNTPINGILAGNLDNVEFFLRYLEDETNFDSVKNKLGSMATLFTNLGTRLTGGQINRFHQLFIDNADKLTVDEITAGMTAYSNLAQQGTYILRAGQEMDVWLNVRYLRGAAERFVTPSFAIICVMFITYFFNNNL